MNTGPLFDAVDVTWPAAKRVHLGAWILRDGQGGGKRVSAATAVQDVTDADIEVAEDAMTNAGQTPLFMIRPEDTDLDRVLAARDYEVVDPVNIYSIALEHLTDKPMPRVTAFCIWEPLAIMEEIWAQGGIGPERIAVMARADIKTGILARWNEKPAGVAFAAVHGGICMVHALEVLPEQRRQGVAQWVMRAAAFWGREQGATDIAVLCTKANTAANELYSSLGFEVVADYHYRQKVM
ncbi:GNAT family N-acetyltransferase [Roseobacter sp. YSTF-M11]|uniref:GNAT family N-acetyltransferase n=1 Tax=Roseobacter insulae TaxID=2859783 RepID=A0A9X1FXC9_9RHOB|nr:GNAT family N-acetyltransferase [Roseobacter insulae]MBW4709446.1 GNAT family N-acetyltransferase [Roseobacter insulae]